MASKTRFPAERAGYEVLQPIGRSERGDSFRAKYSGGYVALKIVDLELLGFKLEHLAKELLLMRCLCHKNVMTCFITFVEPYSHELIVVEPLMDLGDMHSILRLHRKNGFEEPLLQIILQQVLAGLSYFHHCNFVHRDVRAGTCLLDSSGVVKLSESRLTVECLEHGNRRKKRQTFVGFPNWMAPEVVEQEGGYDARADIWSFGLAITELATGKIPYEGLQPLKVLKCILRGTPPKLTGDYSKNLLDLVDQCLRRKPEERASVSKLQEHPFFKGTKKCEVLAASLVGIPYIWDRVKIAPEEVHRPQNGSAEWDFDICKLDNLGEEEMA
eukprot:CAMPEP_0114550050 /NCGR_PEP_ID=MMETSP0114-20121206/5861_1 /TAXON_ID=31324 /ORGANISM="Goniomonas sp, Strain m" /LENGTH=327 /DNA_ID=CAMNT_0001734787 /DNA_START=35 /DNA_END=1014 /DNA_ORIENTATION=+